MSVTIRNRMGYNNEGIYVDFRQLYVIEMPVRPLTAELAEKAQIELFEDPKKLEDGIQHLKDWIAKQPHLRARTDDQWLAAFLRGCKFSLERAKEKIDLYYSMKSLAPELCLLKPKDPKFMEIAKMGITIVLTKTEKPTDPRVMMMNCGYDPNKYSIGEIVSVSQAMQLIMLMEDDAFVIAGGVSIMDFEKASLAHFTQVTPTQMKKMVVAGQDAAPVRMKGAHYLNMPSAFETLLSVVKKFLNEKNRNRIFVHGKDLEGLYKHVPKDILPAEYGGNGGTIEEIADYWAKKMEEYSDWLEEEDKYGTDEALRPGKPRTAEDMFGLDGSFRQLSFD